MKKLITIISLLILNTSCTLNFIEDERLLSKKRTEYEIKTMQLDYLEQLYRIKSSMSYHERMKKIDSLIDSENFKKLP